MGFYQTLFILIAISYQAQSQERRGDILFKNIGTYMVGDIEKTLWVPRHMKAQWYLTRPICKAHGFDILTITTLDEFNRVAKVCADNMEMFSNIVHIGGATVAGGSLDQWFWITTNEKISNDLPWGKNEPNNANSNEFCLSLVRDDGFKFYDMACQGGDDHKFVCESVRSFSTTEANLILF